MSIVNGTFNTDLSGWTVNTSGNADVIWDSGRAKLRVYQCSNASLEQTFVIDQNTLSFDFQTSSDYWSEIIQWELIIGGTSVISDTLPYTTSYEPINESGTKTADLSAYIGQTATLRFEIVQSGYCSNGDHANTYLWIDNITLTGSAPNTGNIVNGTFDTNLNGWTPSGDGSYDVIWENSGPTPGRAMLRISHCSHAAIEQTFLINTNNLKFDWQTYSNGWYENPLWSLTVDGAIVINEGFNIGPWAGDSGTRVVDVSSYIGKTATIRFYLESGSWCFAGDHIATYLWVDNVMLTGAASNIGSIAFSSVPTGASVILDNTDTGQITPYTVSNQTPGTHSYTLKLTNYQDYSGTVEVLSGQTANVTVTLQPLYGNLSVTSVPTGAKIFIDEIDTGKVAPATINNLTAGSHTYRLSKFAYFDSIGTIDVIANTTTTLSITMTAMATTCQVFSSIPKDANIIINGWDLGYKTPINLCGIPYGYNYFELEGTFTIEQKGKPVQPFVSVPKGAKVIVDGLYMGDAPIVLKDIPVGTHTYRLMGTFTA